MVTAVLDRFLETVHHHTYARNARVIREQISMERCLGMKTIFRMTAICLATALAFGASSASAVTLVNGSFEDDAGVALDGQSFDTLATGSGNSSWSVFSGLPGWTTASGTGIEIQTENTLGLAPPPGGGQHYVELDSNNNSSMQQSITFDSIGTYVLSFWYSPRDGDADSNIIDYSIASLTGSVTGPSNVTPVTIVGLWTLIEATFVITDITNPYVLTFAANGTNNSLGGFIDNVSIAAVPVPAGGLLLLGALGGLAALRRRKSV